MFPDNTSTIVKSFKDSRIRYIRNEPNLGHLRNYNKGISLSQGKYVWLISADDYLRRPYVLERYVNLLDERPHVGYAFCSGVGVLNGEETGVVGSSMYKAQDRIINGHVFLRDLLKFNFVLAASGLARRRCYEEISFFPVDMPWAGDWYLWCVFALHYDVAYFAEPMVCYRQHGLSMTTSLMGDGGTRCRDEDIDILLQIRRKADDAGCAGISRRCLAAVAERFGQSRASGDIVTSLRLEELEQLVWSKEANEADRKWLRARIFASMGNTYYWQGKRLLAKQSYTDCLRADPLMWKVYAKRFALTLGVFGDFLWKSAKRGHAI